MTGTRPTPSFPPVEPLRLSTGEFPLHEYRLRAGDREWSVLHTTAILSHQDEVRFLEEMIDRLPYGVALWPAAIALAHEVAGRAEALRGAAVLELGAGTGLPGIVAASVGARVTQTDGHELALYVCGTWHRTAGSSSATPSAPRACGCWSRCRRKGGASRSAGGASVRRAPPGPSGCTSCARRPSAARWRARGR